MKIFRNRAYTLVEVMMTILIFVMIMGGLYAGLLAGGRSWQAYDDKSLTQREARRAFVTMNRDLRMAHNLSFKKNEKYAVVFSFKHPDQGMVTYAWSLPGDRRSASLTRSHGDVVWVIARNISGLTVEESNDVIRFSVSAVPPDSQGPPQEFELTGQVMKR